ncbi:MAG: tRNA 2-thiouridine(34) synthase MnmA [Firmicutes bacterium]|nr:tRNA 2-thiouridine(34) synthase MnmA [Bacillota bacterium]MCL1954291.1 tRNA 2-thiouridine(34) synthase MnmA [Bacillota bacterium]
MANISNKKTSQQTTVVVGLSGGVDSSVAAALLLEQGYNVVGVFMKNWEDTEQYTSECLAAEDYRDVVNVCGKLGIKHYTVNFVQKYRDEVFDYFLKTLQKGNTPNPDVLCNRQIKFGAFFDFAIQQLGADFVATGHYAKAQDGNLYRAKDQSKDQTYFLNQVHTDKLRQTIFPLADYLKVDIRALANKYGLSTASKKDSTGICFVGERNFKDFVHQFLQPNPGDIVDTQGNIVGKHTGLHGYTIGQRRGLGIGGVKDSQGSWFVVSKEISTNRLVVKQSDQSVLNSTQCKVDNINLIGKSNWQKGNTYQCTAKFRYRQQDVAVTVNFDDITTVVFETPQRAVTVGQYAVFYDGQRCLGGGEIIQ